MQYMNAYSTNLDLLESSYTQEQEPKYPWNKKTGLYFFHTTSVHFIPFN